MILISSTNIKMRVLNKSVARLKQFYLLLILLGCILAQLIKVYKDNKVVVKAAMLKKITLNYTTLIL